MKKIRLLKAAILLAIGCFGSQAAFSQTVTLNASKWYISVGTTDMSLSQVGVQYGANSATFFISKALNPIAQNIPYTNIIKGDTIPTRAFRNAADLKQYVRENGFFVSATGGGGGAGGGQILNTPALSFVSTSPTDISLAWGAVTNATQYVLQKSLTSNFSSPSQIYTGGATSFDNTGLPQSTLFYYRLKAQGISWIDSQFSPVVSDSTTTQTYSHIYNISAGSDNWFRIDGSTTTYLDNSLIVLAPGDNWGIDIQHLNPATKITIKNGNGLVRLAGVINYSNSSNILLAGNGSSDEYGIYVYSQNYRPTTISGINRNVTMQNVWYYGTGNYPINFVNESTVWDGTDATVRNINSKFLHCRFEGLTAPIQLGGSVPFDGTAVQDLAKGIEFGWCTWNNCDSGDLIFGGAVDGYSIHDCIFTNINTTNNNDNGLIHIVGTGDYYRNYANSYQGHVIRFWALTFGNIPKTCLSYDNISLNSRKYSAFEFQSSAGVNISGLAPNTTYAHVKISNNTNGNLNYEQHTEFDAVLVENYVMPAGAVVEIYNNVLYNTYAQSGQGAGRILQFTNGTQETQMLAQKNIYYTDHTAAGFDETTLQLSSGSPAKNAGLGANLIIPTDFHGNTFNPTTPSIGAVQ